MEKRFLKFTIKANPFLGKGMYSLFTEYLESDKYRWGPFIMYSGSWESCVKFLKGMGW